MIHCMLLQLFLGNVSGVMLHHFQNPLGFWYGVLRTTLYVFMFFYQCLHPFQRGQLAASVLGKIACSTLPYK